MHISHRYSSTPQLSKPLFGQDWTHFFEGLDHSNFFEMRNLLLVQHTIFICAGNGLVGFSGFVFWVCLFVCFLS